MFFDKKDFEEYQASPEIRREAFTQLKTAQKKEQRQKSTHYTHPLEVILARMDRPKQPSEGHVEKARKLSGEKARDFMHKYLEDYGMESEMGQEGRESPRTNEDYVEKYLTSAILRFQQATGEDIGPIIREAFNAMQEKTALAASDAMGISREALQKKAAMLQCSVEDVAAMEVMANGLAKKAQLDPGSMTPGEVDFLEQMVAVQSAATGVIPEKYAEQHFPDAVLKAVHKSASMAELLMKKDQDKMESMRSPHPAFLVDTQSARDAKDEEAGRPHKRERRDQIKAIFGGP